LTGEKRNQQQADSAEKIFPIPSALGEIKENITINTNTPSKPSKEQIINQAIKLHSQGNISEAAKHYQYLINQGLNDYRIFSNYGVILKNLGKAQNAELYLRKAIELKPKYADAHSNLGNVLRYLGKLQLNYISYLASILDIRPAFVAFFNGLKYKDISIYT